MRLSRIKIKASCFLPWRKISQANKNIKAKASKMKTQAMGFDIAAVTSVKRVKKTQRNTPFGTRKPKMARANNAEREAEVRESVFIV